MRTKIIFNLLLFSIIALQTFGQIDVSRACAVGKKMAFANVQTLVVYAGDSTIDITYYKLNLTITNTPQYLLGETTVSLKPKQVIRNLYLDLLNATMKTDSVVLVNKKLNFTHQNDKLQINLDRNYALNEVITLKIYHQGNPQAPTNTFTPAFSFGTHGNDTTLFPIISTLSEPFGASSWFPCKNTPADKADSSDVWITVPSQFIAVSNGKLVQIVDNKGITKTYKWKNSYPIAQYLISIALSNYTQYNNYFKYSASDSMLVSHFIYPENFTPAVKNQLDQTPIILDLFSRKFGLYPFIKEKYGHAQFNWSGGMEHQTCASMVSFEGYLIAHEMTHQWFGDKITCKNWENIWLNEGFASYGECLYAELLGGNTDYQNYINSFGIRAKNAIGTIYVQKPLDENQIFDENRSYAKGAWVLHSLRGIVGDDLFFKILQTYTASKFAYDVATTENFQAIAEQVSGLKLDYFFKEWIYGENYPKYTYNWAKIKDGNAYKFAILIHQTTNTSPTFFTMPIDLTIGTATKDTVITVFNNQATQNFIIKLPSEPKSVTFDASHKILKDLTFDAKIIVDTLGTITEIEPTEKNTSWKISPNPTENDITFELNLTKESQVTLDLFSITGRKIRNLINEKLPMGTVKKTFLLSDLIGGTYILSLTNDESISTKKIIIR